VPSTRPGHSLAVRLSAALLAGVAAAWLAGTQAYTRFDAIRVRLATTPMAATGGVVRLALPADHGALVTQPLALVGVIRNDAAVRATLGLWVDDRRVCDIGVGPGATRRFDCVVSTPTSRPTVEVRGPESGWSVRTLELATHYGGTRGVLEMYVVPLPSTAYVPAGVPISAAIGTALVIVLLLPTLPWRRRATWVHGVATILVIAALGCVVLAPVVSHYRLIVSVRALVLWLVLLAAPQISFIGARLLGSLQRALPGLRRPLAASIVVGVLVGGLYAAVVANRLAEFHGNPSGLLRISRSIFDHSPLVSGRDDMRRSLILEDSDGYDAQFFYFVALDPFIRALRDQPEQYRRVIDAPVYRYGRIGFSLMADAVTFGQWPRLPWAMVGLVLTALGLTATALAQLAQRQGLTPAAGLLVLLVPGFWQSIQVTLPEPLASMFLVGGVLWAVQGRYRWAGLSFAAALLVRETGLLLVLAVAWSAWRTDGVTAARRLCLIALAPIVVWRIYVAVAFYPVFGAGALFQNPHDLTLPFRGFIDLWTAVWRDTYAPGNAGLNRAALWYPVVLTFGLVTALRLAWTDPRALTLSAAGYALLAVSLNLPSIWVHVANGQRGTFEMFVALALVSVTLGAEVARRHRLLLWTFWTLAGGYVLFGAFDAGLVRDAIFG
jgi:hypothetical protein